jgi:hypothetical protein
VTLIARSRNEPGPHADLYRVAWVDKDGDAHTDTDLTWAQACAAYSRLDHIVGNYQVRITAQGGAG